MATIDEVVQIEGENFVVGPGGDMAIVGAKNPVALFPRGNWRFASEASAYEGITPHNLGFDAQSEQLAQVTRQRDAARAELAVFRLKELRRRATHLFGE